VETLTAPQGSFALARYPARRKDLLRAWDAADEYLLQYLADNELPRSGSRILILNDGFGALSVALADHVPHMLSDSWLAQQATLANLSRNGLATDSVNLTDSLMMPEGVFDVVLLKIPKSLALLEDQLHRIRPCLRDETVFLGAGMVKGIHRSTLRLCERIIGPVTTSLARKKARLVLPQFDPQLNPGVSPWPRRYRLEDTPFEIINHANVFSRERLDIGTRLLLEHLPSTHGAIQAIDLGCGNGVVGLMLKARNLQAELSFVDESFMAVASARQNFAAAFPQDQSARFITGDCLAGFEPASADLVLINPPFHQQQAITSSIARQMFRDALRVLRPGGECRVIGNRHLGYHKMLRQVFGHAEVVASNAKFVVFSAVRS
jgi:16S rRNA (guanine1207-N2)-methyltransferase